MKFDTIEYDVAEMAQAPERLVISAAGAARYASHTNAGAPDRQAIGVYEHTLSESDLEPLERMLLSTPLGPVPDHMGRIVSGDRYRKLVVTHGTETIQKAVGTREPVDARLLALFQKLDTLASVTLEHPRNVLGIDVHGATMSRDKLVRVDVTLSSRGSQSVVCRSPVALVGAPDGWIAIQLWPDVPVKQLGAGDIHRANATRVADLRQPPSFAATLEIPPGGSATFRVEAKLEGAKPGPSVIRVSYASFHPGPSGRPTLVGELQAKTIKIDVPGGGAR